MHEVKFTNVVVVGGAGFLGSHLVDYLINECNCKVTVVDNLCVGRRHFIHEEADLVHHDITGSEEFLVKLFERENIEFVFNYAAWPYIPVSFQRPLHVFEVNATGAFKVINAAHAAGCNGILQVSSAEIYGEERTGRIAEDAPVRPHSSYGAAKAAVDYYCQAAWRERGAPVVALRQFNCVGARETHPYVVPEIISQLTNGPVVRLGNNSRRDFMHAKDAVRIAVKLMEQEQWGEVFNLGSEEAIDIYSLAALVGNVMGYGGDVRIEEDFAKIRPWEIWHLQSNNDKILKVVGEAAGPRYRIRDAVEDAVNDYKENLNRWVWEE